MAEGQREYLQGVIEFYQARTNTKMTIAAERLAVIAAVTLPMTALSSIVGMNVIVNESTHVGQLGPPARGDGGHVHDAARLGPPQGLVVGGSVSFRAAEQPGRPGNGPGSLEADVAWWRADMTVTGEAGTPDCDLLVVGGGAAGLAGAVTAAYHGLTVVVAEKAPVLGGATSWSGAGCGRR